MLIMYNLDLLQFEESVIAEHCYKVNFISTKLLQHRFFTAVYILRHCHKNRAAQFDSKNCHM